MNLTEKQKVAHLLRRFGLGASEAELEYYGKNGLNGAIQLLLDFDKAPDVVKWDPMEFANKQGTVNIRVMQTLWYARILGTQRPLEEKLTLFWHNHFATSSSKVENSFAMNNHVDVLRTNCMGNFKTFLYDISKNPAMLYWLDNQENVVGKPNENFAREVMELFTLGVDNYTEKDIQEAARAFTGWRYGIGRRVNNQSPRRVDRFIYVADQHDNGQKTIFGKTGNFNGDDVLDMLCEKPETAKFIAKKMWEWFAYPNPEPAVLNRIAKTFFDSKLEIRALVKSIMESPEFYGEKSYRQNVKNPIDFALVVARQLGVGQVMIDRVQEGVQNPLKDEQFGVNTKLVRAIGPCFAIHQATTSMGMELMSPPDVSGWRTGNYWITSATMVERVKWADRIFIGGPAVPAQNIGGNTGNRRAPSINFDPWLIFQSDPTPQGVVKSLLSIFDVEMSATQQNQLIEGAKTVSSGKINRANSADVARSVTRSIFASPAFQFA